MGRYTNAGSVKAFTLNAAIKALDDAYLEANLIPRAEALLDGLYGPFRQPIVAPCTDNLMLAANMLVEYVYYRAQGFGPTVSGIKSESMGNYSYTLGGTGVTPDSDLQFFFDEIAALLNACMDPNADRSQVASGSTRVFPQLPGYDDEGSVFDTAIEASYPFIDRRIRVWWR